MNVMLDLNSKRWRELTHAYGSASDIPALIAQLKTAPPPEKGDWEAEPWFSLWSALCHQDDVYTASYAAVPHIVAIAAAKPEDERAEFIHFVAWVEVCRHDKEAPQIPVDLDADYSGALRQGARLALECLRLDWDEDDYQALLGGLAVLQGKPALGAAILDPSEEVQCPKCGTLFPKPGHWLFEDNEAEND